MQTSTQPWEVFISSETFLWKKSRTVEQQEEECADLKRNLQVGIINHKQFIPTKRNLVPLLYQSIWLVLLVLFPSLGRMSTGNYATVAQSNSYMLRLCYTQPNQVTACIAF